jgi:hypothetical protein
MQALANGVDVSSSRVLEACERVELVFVLKAWLVSGQAICIVRWHCIVEVLRKMLVGRLVMHEGCPFCFAILFADILTING